MPREAASYTTEPDVDGVSLHVRIFFDRTVLFELRVDKTLSPNDFIPGAHDIASMSQAEFKKLAWWMFTQINPTP
jgi:hypothetical protein